jgi:predicted dithiol-disulfide oxidoreductase (DUF899 family)
MEPKQVVSQAEWFKAHKAHLAREKELTHLRDQIAKERRALPWLKLEKSYVFETAAGKKTLAELFGNNSQLIVYHFMLAPGSSHRCVGCSVLSDHIDGALPHLVNHDVSFVVASRAPLAELLPFKQRMGWKFDWVSTGDNTFNYDLDVSYTDKQLASGKVTYNFDELSLSPAQNMHDLPGISVFYKDERGDVFLTFEARARGGDLLIGAFNYLDLTPKGRNEAPPNRGWVRLHDKY